MGIISVDAVLAIPIAAVSIMLIASGISTSQSFLVSYSKYSYVQARYYSISQQIISILSSQNPNAIEYNYQLENLTRFYNVSVNLIGLNDYQSCADQFCRVVDVAGVTKIMVIK